MDRSRSIRSRHCAGRAFSLVELLAVIAVLGVLSVLVVPASWWMIAARTGAAARLITQDLTYARELAMDSGTPTWAAFTTATNRYDLLVEDPASPGRAGAQPMFDPGTGYAFTQFLGTGEFPGVSLISATFDAGHDVGFDWLGRPLAATGSLLAARGTITLNDGYGCVVEVGTGAAWQTSP